MRGHPGANGSFPHLCILSTLWRTPAALRPVHQRHAPTGEPELAHELLCNQSRTTSKPGRISSSWTFIQFRFVTLFSLLIPDRNAKGMLNDQIKHSIENISHYLQEFTWDLVLLWFHWFFSSRRFSSSHAAHPGVAREAPQFSRRLTRPVHQQSFLGTKSGVSAPIG